MGQRVGLAGAQDVHVHTRQAPDQGCQGRRSPWFAGGDWGGLDGSLLRLSGRREAQINEQPTGRCE